MAQVPRQGDYFTTSIGSQPIVMVRHTDDSVRVLLNLKGLVWAAARDGER